MRDEATAMLSRNRPIWKAAQLQKALGGEQGEHLSNQAVRRVLRRDLRLRYRRVKKIPVQANSERCLVLRQQYALKMLLHLSKGKRVINVDESWISETDFSRRMWCPVTAAATVTERAVIPRLALLAALDTDGQVYFALTHAVTDSEVISLFLAHLARMLDAEQPGWRDQAILLLDGARYHVSAETRSVIRKLQLPCMFSGPYSFSTAPIELLFAGLKTGEL